MNQDVLIFQMDDLLLGVSVEFVQEVVRAVAMSAVPGSWVDYEGIINCRGTAIPVFDLRKRLKLSPRPLRLSDGLILLEDNGNRLAVRVDRALELVPFSENRLKPLNESDRNCDIFQGMLEYDANLAFMIDPRKCFPESLPKIAGPKIS